MTQPAYAEGAGVIGVGWPWSATGPSFKTGTDLIEDKMALIVATYVGSHKMEIGFGSDLISLVFENITVLRSLAELSIRNALGRWLPEVAVRRVSVEEDPLIEGAVLVNVVYEYLGQDNALGVSLGGSPGV